MNNTGGIKLSNNVLSLDDIYSEAFKGTIKGYTDVNLLNYFINAKIRGEHIDTDDALVALVNMKDTLKGDLFFDANVALKGLTYNEQVNSLNGKVDFSILNV